MMIQVKVTMTWWTDYVTTLMLHLQDQLHRLFGNRRLYVDSAPRQTKPGENKNNTFNKIQH